MVIQPNGTYVQRVIKVIYALVLDVILNTLVHTHVLVVFSSSSEQESHE